MRVVGISEGYHDAGYCVLDGDEITHASHSERYSRVKNDPFIHVDNVIITNTWKKSYERDMQIN